MPSELYIHQIKPGQTEAARAFVRAMSGERQGEFLSSEKLGKISREHWYIHHISDQDLLICFVEAPDLDESNKILATSQHPYECWSREQLRTITGMEITPETSRKVCAETLLEYKEPTLVESVRQ